MAGGSDRRRARIRLVGQATLLDRSAATGYFAAFEREEKAALAYRDAWTAGARDARDEAGTAPAVS